MSIWKRWFGREPAPAPVRNDEALNLTITTWIAVAMADGEFEAPEAERVAAEYRKLTGDEVSVDFVKRTARIVADGSFSLVGDLHEAAAKLGPEERERIWVGAVALARADGEAEPEENALIARVANALGVSPERRREIVPPGP